MQRLFGNRIRSYLFKADVIINYSWCGIRDLLTANLDQKIALASRLASAVVAISTSPFLSEIRRVDQLVVLLMGRLMV